MLSLHHPFFQLNGPKLYQMDNLHSEHAMTLFVLGALFRDRALEVLSTDLVQSASFLRKAAGVYHHITHDVLPCLRPASAQERPPEGVISVSTAITLVCLAEAQVGLNRLSCFHFLLKLSYNDNIYISFIRI